jgi:hypothetical protein
VRLEGAARFAFAISGVSTIVADTENNKVTIIRWQARKFIMSTIVFKLKRRASRIRVLFVEKSQLAALSSKALWQDSSAD